MALSPVERDILAKDGAFMLDSVLKLIAAVIFWGMYHIVFSFSVHCMMMRQTKTRAWLAMFTLLIMLFAVAWASAGIHIHRNFLQISAVLNGNRDSGPSASVLVHPRVAEYFVYFFQFLAGDAIVVWRTWALWKDSRAIYLPMTLWLAALGTLLAERIVYLSSITTPVTTTPGPHVSSNATYVVPSLTTAGYALSVATNALSTAMIACKAWVYHRELKQLCLKHPPTAAERILALLVESGTFYLIFWGMCIMANFDTETYGNLHLFQGIWGYISDQFVSLYPTVVIALVELERSIRDTVELSLSLELPIVEDGRNAEDHEPTRDEECLFHSVESVP